MVNFANDRRKTDPSLGELVSRGWQVGISSPGQSGKRSAPVVQTCGRLLRANVWRFYDEILGSPTIYESFPMKNIAGQRSYIGSHGRAKLCLENGGQTGTEWMYRLTNGMSRATVPDRDRFIPISTTSSFARRRLLSGSLRSLREIATTHLTLPTPTQHHPNRRDPIPRNRVDRPTRMPRKTAKLPMRGKRSDTNRSRISPSRSGRRSPK